MGIRINKVIGYGLTDVIADTDNWNLKNDPRFNQKGYFGMDCETQEDSFSVEGFKEYLEKKIESLVEGDFSRMELMLTKRFLEDTKLHGIWEGAVYDMEFGNPEVMVFVPLTSVNRWKRYDDMIDYYDPVNSSQDSGIENSLIKLNRALYPYDSYVNIKSGVPVRLNSLQWQTLIFIKNRGDDGLKDGDVILSELGVESREELEKYIVPTIPEELIELIKYLKIFNDEKDIYQLRPMIYGYWS